MWRDENNRTVALLRRMPLFAGCRRRELEQLGLLADEVQVPSGFALVRADELPVDCFLLLSGQVAVTVRDASLGTAGPDALLGVQSLRDGTPRAASVITLEPTRVLSMTYAGMRQLLSCPQVAERFMTAGPALPETYLATLGLPGQRQESLTARGSVIAT